jgi:DNA gyrase inhibitor GyrI
MNKASKILTVSAALATSLVFVAAGRAGYESAPYKVVRSTGKFQVRDYPALTVAETTMESGPDHRDGSFNRLFGFISGGNESEQRIAMTTPVLVSVRETNATMAFVMPAKMTTSDVPKPTSGQVRVRQQTGGRFAVFRFSGRRNSTNEAEALISLRAWMAGEGLKESSLPVFAYFDPPWTPAFMCRNEVMLRVETPP